MIKESEMTIADKNVSSYSLPPFSEIHADAEEQQAASEEMRLLYHRLGYLDRNCMVPIQPHIEGGNAIIRMIKRCIGKVCLFLLHPIVTTQNRINIQEANYLRDIVHQLDLLTAENKQLKRELAEVRERLSS